MTPALPTNPLADAMERATGEVLTANQRAYLSSLTGGMERAVEAAYESWIDLAGPTMRALPETHLLRRQGREMTEGFVRAAAPFLVGPLQAEVERLTGERDTEARQHERLQRIYLDTCERLSTAEAALRASEAEAKMSRWWLWAAIRSVGGEVRISHKLADESPMDGIIERDDDLTTCDRILRAKEAPHA